MQQRKKQALPEGEEVKLMNFRIPASLLKEVKLYCAREEMSVQDFMNNLVRGFLEEIGKLP